MKEYAHIDSIFKRDARGKFLPEFSVPAFAYLENNTWIGTEKVDGTNIRVMWFPATQNVVFGGKTDNAQIPSFLLTKLQELFPPRRMAEVFPDQAVCLYGEGFGARIQKGGGNYIPDGVSFVLFDVLIDRWWLERDALEDIAKKLDIQIVPIIFRGSLAAAVEFTSKIGFLSSWGNFDAEGLVLKPEVEMFQRNGERVITKVKTKDFR